MIIRTRSGNTEIRSGEWGTSWHIPQPGTNMVSKAGVLVNDEEVFGLPAVSNVIRSPSEVIASLPFMVYTGKPRKRAEGSWQWSLLHDDPDSEGTGTFQFFNDLNVSLESVQNTFIQKVKRRKRSSRIYELKILDPQRVRCYIGKDGYKKFDIYIGAGETLVGLDNREILHIRGFTPRPGSCVGMSLVAIHRNQLGNSLAMQAFEGDYFRNNAVPPFWFTGAKNKEHAQDLVAGHNAAHQGAGKQRKVGALWGQIDVKTVPVTMDDAQYIEARQMTIEEACRIWRWPKELLELTQSASGRPPTDENQWMARAMKFYILPRLKRIESAFKSDPDLFDQGKYVGEFLTAALERADFITRMQGYKDARQGGWATANEIRDYENLPPRADGDTLLETPTGSAPNTVPSRKPGGQQQDNGGSRNGSVQQLEEMLT